mmetsp:Transcript_30841/g.46795  ORF Transcript_30841/g.46795 Transcript_30841/m.46795 type:complete len:1229 (+) Transcript_30841:140-3826(+)
MVMGLLVLQFLLSVYAFAPGRRCVLSEIKINLHNENVKYSITSALIPPYKRNAMVTTMSANHHLESIERWYKNSESGPGTKSYLDTLPSNFAAGSLQGIESKTEKCNETITFSNTMKQQYRNVLSNEARKIGSLNPEAAFCLPSDRHETNVGKSNGLSETINESIRQKPPWSHVSTKGYQEEILEAESIIAAALQSINNVSKELSSVYEGAEKPYSNTIATRREQKNEADARIHKRDLASLNAEKIELENSVSELRMAQAQWESTVAELREQKSLLESATSQLGVEKQELDDLANNLREQLDEASKRQQQQKLDTQIKNKQLMTLNAEKQQLESTVRELQATQGEWENTVEQLKHQKKCLESATLQLEVEKQELNAMSENFQRELERACVAQNQQGLDTKRKDDQLCTLNATKIHLEKEINELLSKEREWEATVRVLQKEKNSLEESTARMKIESKQLDSLAEDLQEQLVQAHSSQNQQELDSKKKENELNALNEKAARLELDVKELQASKHEWESKIAELQKRNSFLESTATRLGNEKNQLTSRTEDVRQQLERAYRVQEKQEQDIEEKSKHLKSLNTEKLELEGEVSKFHRTQNEWKAIVNEIQKQKAFMEVEMTRLASEKKELEGKAADVLQQLEQAKSAQHEQELETKSKNEEISLLNKAIHELEETVAGLRATENEWETTVMALQEQKNCLESATFQLEAEKEELNTILEEFRNQLVQAHSERDKQKHDTKGKNLELKHLNEEKIQLEKTIQKLRAAENKWEATVEELQLQKNTLELDISKLEAEKEELEVIASDLRQQLERAYSMQQQQELKVKKKDEQLEKLNDENRQLQNKVTELESTHDKWKTTVSELERNKRRLETMTTQLEAEKEQLDAIAGDLRQQVNLWQTAAKEEEEKSIALNKEKNKLREFVSTNLGSQDSRGFQEFEERGKLENKVSVLKREKEELEMKAIKMKESENALTEELTILRKQLNIVGKNDSQDMAERPSTKAPVISVQGDSLKTWSFASPAVENVQVVLMTEGRPLDADVELWAGPDNIPQRIRVYVENGSTRPFRTLIRTPRSPNTIAIRNIGQVELPLAAQIDALSSSNSLGLDGIDTSTKPMASPVVIQGGALRTYPFGSDVESVQVHLKTDGRPLNARIELLQGPNNSKQVIQVYTEDGLERPFYAVVSTPGSGNVIWIMNTASVEFPMTASIAPYQMSNKPSLDDLEPVINGFGGLSDR